MKKICCAVVLGLLAALPMGAPAQAAKKEPGLVFSDSSYEFELRRAMGYAISGGADLNECLQTAGAIKQGNADSWYENWQTLAGRILAMGEASLKAGHRISAREAFLRASNYFREAEFYLHGNPQDPRIMQAWSQSRDCFGKAAKLMDTPVEVIKIPYGKTTLPGYFLRPDHTGRKRKTLILQTGFDGTGEELYFAMGFFALKRGYNVLIFEGPGQGGALREQHLYFRPDWEKVVVPVTDYALSRREVDPKRLALIGFSMGGYLAPRGAAFEPRLAALIANPGVYDLNGRGFPSPQELAEMTKYAKQANQKIRQSMAKDIGFRWWVENGMFTTGKKTPVEFMDFWTKFTLKGLAGRIKCPTLVIVSQADVFFDIKSQEKLYEKLTCPKTLMVFKKDGYAPQHCQEGAMAISNQRILDWLDETLAKVR